MAIRSIHPFASSSRIILLVRLFNGGSILLFRPFFNPRCRPREPRLGSAFIKLRRRAHSPRIHLHQRVLCGEPAAAATFHAGHGHTTAFSHNHARSHSSFDDLRFSPLCFSQLFSGSKRLSREDPLGRCSAARPGHATTTFFWPEIRPLPREICSWSRPCLRRH